MESSPSPNAHTKVGFWFCSPKNFKVWPDSEGQKTHQKSLDSSHFILAKKKSIWVKGSFGITRSKLTYRSLLPLQKDTHTHQGVYWLAYTVLRTLWSILSQQCQKQARKSSNCSQFDLAKRKAFMEGCDSQSMSSQGFAVSASIKIVPYRGSEERLVNSNGQCDAGTQNFGRM